VTLNQTTPIEDTLVILKPDALARGLTGEIIVRFERIGMRILQGRIFLPSSELVERHYPETDEWLTGVGRKTLSDYQNMGLDPVHAFGTDDLREIGHRVKAWLVDYLTSGPVCALVLNGHRAVEIVRKLIGATLPVQAMPGTIRGDFCSDSAILAGQEKRAVRNLIHASGTVPEAHDEIALWFSAA